MLEHNAHRAKVFLLHAHLLICSLQLLAPVKDANNVVVVAGEDYRLAGLSAHAAADRSTPFPDYIHNPLSIGCSHRSPMGFMDRHEAALTVHRFITLFGEGCFVNTVARVSKRMLVNGLEGASFCDARLFAAMSVLSHDARSSNEEVREAIRDRDEVILAASTLSLIRQDRRAVRVLG
tara:strand:+ start:184 stop:717 length:534 start_codon:yes stop_codon:yes gene_type:complete